MTGDQIIKTQNPKTTKLLFHTSSSSVIGLKSFELIEDPPLINNFASMTSNLSYLFIGFNIAEFPTKVIYFSYTLLK